MSAFAALGTPICWLPILTAGRPDNNYYEQFMGYFPFQKWFYFSTSWVRSSGFFLGVFFVKLSVFTQFYVFFTQFYMFLHNSDDFSWHMIYFADLADSDKKADI